MAEKDFRKKRLEDFDDVFADIINGLLFHGEKRVLENELESGMPRSAYKIDSQRFRGLLKNGGIKTCIR